MPTNIAHDLATLLPPNRIAQDEPTRTHFAGDKWQRGPLPDLVVRPRSTAEVATVLQYANQNNIPVTTRGAGWGYVGGAVTSHGGICLSLDAMNAIREISNADFVAIVEAGVNTQNLQNAVRAQSLFYPPDPASSANCSIGGNIATNAGGPRCLKYGVTRHYVLGLEVVLANGTILNLGGRTHKNATGFDLLGLFVGSEGLLGIVTTATLRLLPHPITRLGLAAVFPNIATAATASNAIFAAGLLPTALEIADQPTYARFQHIHQLPSQPGAHLLVEVDGSPEGTRADLSQIKDILRHSGAQNLEIARDETEVENLWETRRAFSTSLTASGKTKLNEDVVVPRGQLVDLVGFAADLGRKHNIEIACFGHAGDGNIHVNLLLETNELHLAEPILDELFTQVLAWGGAITGEHGIGLAKKRWWPQSVSPVVRELHERMKSTLDPKGILNPGKWL